MREVSERVAAISAATDAADETGSRITEASNRMTGLTEALSTRFTMLIRQTEAGNRRRHDRFPVDLKGRLEGAGLELAVNTLDISEGGTLLKVSQTRPVAVGTRAVLVLPEVGRLPVAIVGSSALGLHCAFAELDEATRAGLERLIARVKSENEGFISAAKETAARIEAALSEAVQSGRLSLDALYDTNYKPVPDSNPQQVTTRALPVLEEILTPVQEQLLEASRGRGMTFCVAVDRNGYLPVHNRIYSHPQKTGRSGLERRQLPQPPHLRRPRRPLRGAQHAALPHPVLSARHGQRPDRVDARDRRAAARLRPPLGRLPHRVQTLRATRTAGREGKTRAAKSVQFPLVRLSSIRHRAAEAVDLFFRVVVVERCAGQRIEPARRQVEPR